MTTAEVETYGPPDDAVLAEYRRALERMLPGLLTTNYGDYVAVHGDRVIAIGPNRNHVLGQAMMEAGLYDFILERIGLRTEYVERIVNFREIRRETKTP